MRCALVCKKYIPDRFDDLSPQFHELTVFLTTTVPSAENFQGLMISTNLRTPIPTAEMIYPEDAYVFDPSINAELLSFRSYLSLLLENIFPMKASSVLRYFVEKGRMDYLLCYQVYYNGCDVYVHPDAVEIFEQHLLNPLRQTNTRGASFVREDMIDLVDTSTFLDTYSRNRNLIEMESKIQKHLFFPKKTSNDSSEDEYVVLSERLREKKELPFGSLTLELTPSEMEKLGSLKLGSKETNYGTTVIVSWENIPNEKKNEILALFKKG